MQEWQVRWFAGVFLPVFVVVKAGRLVSWDAAETVEAMRYLGAESVLLMTLAGLIPLVLGTVTGALWATSTRDLRRRPGVRPVALSMAVLFVLLGPAYLVLAVALLLCYERLSGRWGFRDIETGGTGSIAAQAALLGILLFWTALLPRGLPLQELQLREGHAQRRVVAAVLGEDAVDVHVVDRAGRVSAVPRSTVVARVRCRESWELASATLLNLVTGDAFSARRCPP